MTMSHRERVLKALNHQEPDRVPLDFGSTANSGIHIEAYARLIESMGLTEEVRVEDLHDVQATRGMRVAKIHEKVLQTFDIDLRPVFLSHPHTWGDIEIDESTYEDGWGLIHHQPTTCSFYNVINAPLSGEIGINDILNRPWPDPEDPGLYEGLHNRAERIYMETDYAVVLHLGSVFIHTSQYLRGFQDWYLDFAANPKIICALMDAILDIRLAICERALQECSGLVDVVSFSDDLADQKGPIISPTMFRKYLKPRFKRYIDKVQAITDAKILFHSCGSVYRILPDIIDLGIDCINPVQVSANQMCSNDLKRDFGKKIVFWGGIDTQQILPLGSAEDVETEVNKRIQDFAPEGGYILCAVHNIQPEVPPLNIQTMYKSAMTNGRYPIDVKSQRVM